MYGLIEKTDAVLARQMPKPNTLSDFLLDWLEIQLDQYPDRCVFPGTVRCPSCGTLNNQDAGSIQGPCRFCKESWVEV